MKALFYAVSFFVLSFASLSLFSCATQAQPAPKAQLSVQPTSLNPVYVTNRAKVFPLTPENIAEDVEGMQIFSGQFTFRGRKIDFSSPVYVQADAQAIVLMLLSDFGVETGTIFFDGKEARIESSFFPTNIKCEYIILDLQNAYYRADALESLYQSAGLEFAETTEDGKKTRIIKQGNKIIEEISIDADVIQIKNRLRSYEYCLTLLRE